MSRLLQASNGAQVLPNVRDERATVTAWAAYCCLNADHRITRPVYAELARTLEVHS